MRYRIRSSNSRSVELALSTPERPLLIVLLSLFSVVFLLLGLAYALSAQDSGDPLRALMFSGFGLFCFLLIFLLPGAFAFPGRLVFDNEAAVLTLHDRAGKWIGELPYSGISRFSVRRTLTDRVARHSAGIELTRGGRWELVAAQGERKAADLCGELKRLVSLDRRGAGPPRDPPLDLDRSTPGVTLFSWKRNVRPVSTSISVLALLSFVGALAASRPFIDGLAAYAVVLAFGGFFLAAVLASALRVIGERTEVRIGRSSLELRRRSALRRNSRFSIALSTIAAVDLSMSFSRQSTKIVLLHAEEVERFVRYRQGDFSGGGSAGAGLFPSRPSRHRRVGLACRAEACAGGAHPRSGAGTFSAGTFGAGVSSPLPHAGGRHDTRAVLSSHAVSLARRAPPCAVVSTGA